MTLSVGSLILETRELMGINLRFPQYYKEITTGGLDITTPFTSHVPFLPDLGQERSL